MLRCFSANCDKRPSPLCPDRTRNSPPVAVCAISDCMLYILCTVRIIVIPILHAIGCHSIFYTPERKDISQCFQFSPHAGKPRRTPCRCSLGKFLIIQCLTDFSNFQQVITCFHFAVFNLPGCIVRISSHNKQVICSCNHFALPG